MQRGVRNVGGGEKIVREGEGGGGGRRRGGGGEQRGTSTHYAQQPGVERFLSARGGTVARFPIIEPKDAETSPDVL
jgi:hypothetical protein